MSDVTAWRIVQERYAATAFDGEGARLYGGRWNSKGTPAFYTAGHLSLAALEMLVHLPDEHLLRAYAAIPVEFDDSMIEDTPFLPPTWSADPVPSSVQAIGDRWIQESRSPVLRVPSAVLPLETNYLLNPRHPDFARLKIGSAHAFRFDGRLLEKRR